jgi:hypothetical protein
MYHDNFQACGLFYKLHGVVRPLSLKTDVIKKRLVCWFRGRVVKKPLLIQHHFVSRNRAAPAKDGTSAVPVRKNSGGANGKGGTGGSRSKASSPTTSNIPFGYGSSAPKRLRTLADEDSN